LSGTALLHLGDRKISVETGQAAEFSTMTPHSIGTLGEPVEILRSSTLTASGRTTNPLPRTVAERWWKREPTTNTYSPVRPSMSSRTMSRWPACRAYSCSR